MEKDKGITCVADFLNYLKNNVSELGKQHKRFFRGLNDFTYAEKDYPSIYRDLSSDKTGKSKETDYEPYIKYEHEMFFDLVSRLPEQFSLCKNTFEHLVMMQHYDFPTRLLDVTSNPLVALYFACVDKYGNAKDKNNEGKDLDGVVAIYDVPNEKIKNYNSDTVTILSNLARMDESYTIFYSKFNSFMDKLNELDQFNWLESLDPYSSKYINCSLKNLSEDLDYIFKNIVKMHYVEKKAPRPSQFADFNINNATKGKIACYFSALKSHISNYTKNNARAMNKFLKIKKRLKLFFEKIVGVYYIEKKSDLRFKHFIQQEKLYFIHEKIKSSDLEDYFCVKPKLNNPRIINQSGAFLIFGFANRDVTKLEPPMQHIKLREEKDPKNKLCITIPASNKSSIIEELKRFNIHHASLFPEIDKVAQVVANEYRQRKVKKNDSTQTI